MVRFKTLCFHIVKALSCNDRLQQTFVFPLKSILITKFYKYTACSPSLYLNYISKKFVKYPF